MSQQSSETSRDPRLSSWLVLVLLVMIVIPATITLNTVQFPGTLQISNSNPTPFGYTISLSLFIIPIIVIGGWLVPSESLAFPAASLLANHRSPGSHRLRAGFLLRQHLLCLSDPGAPLGSVLQP